MSNQSNDDFQGSQPFINDKEYKSLSLDQLRYILNQKKQGLKDNYKKLGEKEKIIRDIRKIDKLNEKVKQGIYIKKEMKKRKNKKITPVKKIKSFDEYFQECIQNKEFPEDTPPYFRETLERAIKEYHQGLVKEKSAFEDFAVKYIFEGDPSLSPIEYFNNVYKTLEDFFTYHRNIKFSMVLVCLMEQQVLSKDKGVVGLNEDKAYFRSGTHINLKSTDVEKLIEKCVKKIIEDLETYKKMEVDGILKKWFNLKFTLLSLIQRRGHHIFLFQIGYRTKKQYLIFKTKMRNAFFGAYLDIFIQEKIMMPY